MLCLWTVTNKNGQWFKNTCFFFCFPRCVNQLGAVVRGAIRWRTEEEEEEEESEKAAGNTLSCTTGKYKNK